MIIRHDRRDRESLVDPCKWPAITGFFRGNGAATLIAPTWLLTAAHVHTLYACAYTLREERRAS